MAADTPALNVTTTDAATIDNPQRHNTGGAVEDRGGVVRSQPGAGADEIGSGSRQVIDPGAAKAPANVPEEETPNADKPADDTGKAQDNGGDAAAPGTPPADPKVNPEAEADKPGADADPRLAPYTAEVTEKGTLSPESITKAAAEFGVSEDIVKAYLKGVTAPDAAPAAGLSAEAQTVVDTAYEIVGGQANYDAFLGTLTDDQKADLAAAADTNNPRILKAAMGPMYEAFKASGGGAGPRSIVHEGAGNGEAAAEQASGYASREEQLTAGRDKRYGKDKAYTAQHDLRVHLSTWAKG